MENYFYSSSQSPSSISPLPLLLPSNKSIDMLLQLDEASSRMQGYQEFNFIPAMCPENSNSQSVMRKHSDPGLRLEPAAGLQALGLSASFSTTVSAPVTPTGSVPESLGECNRRRSYSTDMTGQSCMKRRLQNRQAQRRFRQRKEERQQTLEQKTASLQSKYQELMEEFNRKSQEASETRREKEALSTEIEDLRKRWQLMVLLLSRPNGLQSLTMLLGNGPNQPLSGTSTTAASPMLGNFVDCLQPLLSPKEAPQITVK
ncbi:hypothetical protein BJX68DRAFT_262330 [Aspergillus pseudodeflectus]|uniref:BZIP domain-containing protein n=1 Tax=Aspergillus pseudodeflectus TaxID=176178 RepID=A0ABR4L5M8_9EURO